VTTPIDRLRALAMFDFPPSDELCAVPGVGPLDPAVILLGLNGEDLIAGFDPAGAGWWGLYVAEERVAEEHAAEEHDPAAPAGRTVVVSTWVYARHDPERLLAFAGGHAPTREALTHAPDGTVVVATWRRPDGVWPEAPEVRTVACADLPEAWLPAAGVCLPRIDVQAGGADGP
jgi:hypothetical protein